MGLGTEPYPEIYLPFSQSPNKAMVVMIRAGGDASALAPAVRRRVGAIDRNLPIESLQPFERSVPASLSQRRFSALLLAFVRRISDGSCRSRHIRTAELLVARAGR
jgi:hypothetical protein